MATTDLTTGVPALAAPLKSPERANTQSTDRRVGMKGTLEEVGEGRWRLRVFLGREAGKVRHVNRNFSAT